MTVPAAFPRGRLLQAVARPSQGLTSSVPAPRPGAPGPSTSRYDRGRRLQLGADHEHSEQHSRGQCAHHALLLQTGESSGTGVAPGRPGRHQGWAEAAGRGLRPGSDRVLPVRSPRCGSRWHLSALACRFAQLMISDRGSEVESDRRVPCYFSLLLSVFFFF